MEQIITDISINEIINVFERFKDSLLNFITTYFGWIGTEAMWALGIGIGIAILLRILGR